MKTKLDQATTLATSTKTVQKIADGEGLMLVVRPSGESSWILRFMVAGKRHDLTLGRWPTVTLKMARDLADTARKKAATGADPVQERKGAKAERALKASMATDTVRKLYDDWLGKREMSDVYRGNIEAAFIKDVLPAIGSKPPHTVDRDAIVKILRVLESRNATVMLRRVRMWLRQMFEYGIDDETRPLLTASPVPTGSLNSYKRNKSKNYPAITNVSDIAPLMRKIRRESNFINRAALMLSAYVWQRPTEIRESKWAEFDLEAGKWVLDQSRMGKGGNEHWVPLARQVVELLRQLQGVVGDDPDGWLFPGRKYGQSISEGTLGAVLDRYGYEGKHTPHGFRAMARTVLDEHLKWDPRFMEKQLSHEVDDSNLKGAYNRAEYWDDRVKMMQAWADFLDAQT